MKEKYKGRWGPQAFEGMDDITLIRLVVAVSEEGTDESDKAFAESIRLELMRRDKVKNKEALQRMINDTPQDR